VKKVEILGTSPLTNPQYIKTELITFTRDGKEFTWEKLTTHDSVHVLIVNTDNEEVLIVKQIRIPILVNDDSQQGEMHEICAGLVDKDAPLEQITKEEILEEVGYNVPLERITHIRNVKGGAGRSGHESYLYYTLVNNAMKVSEGGGLENEDIEVVSIPYTEIKDFLNGGLHTDTVTLYLLAHFLINKEEILLGIN
jgi:UDP-sugar diphosphatase